MRQFMTSLAASLLLAACMATLAMPAPINSAQSEATIVDIPVLASPNADTQVRIAVDNDGRATYAVSYRGKPVILPSRLGFTFVDERNMIRNFRAVDVRTSNHDESWQQPWGERRTVRDQHNELAVTFEQTDQKRRRMVLRVRAFDEGVGFRYEFPDRTEEQVTRIAEEMTEINFAENGSAWWIPGGEWNRYEYLYEQSAIDSVSTAHTPITAKLESGTHVSVHEAALVDYSGMRLKRQAGLNFRSDLAPSSDAGKVTLIGPFVTPWRTISLGDSAVDLINTDIVLNLNEPNTLGDVSWVKPTRYIGIWWGMFLGAFTWSTGPKHGATTENAKRYIDFAEQHGFDAVLIEGWNPGWDGNWFGNGDEFRFTETVDDFDIAEITDYADARGIKIIGHHETGGNIANYEASLEAAFSYYQSLGVESVKTGYVADGGGIIAQDPNSNSTRMEWHDGQRQVEHNLNVVKTAAKYGISINTHEPVKDTGLRRTYPNWITREGARGMEYNAFVPPLNPADHIAILAFTRMLSGPMDFTPGILSLRGAGDNIIPSTLAKQMALYVVVYSPLQMAADTPERLALYPRELDFISTIPVDWEHSVALTGEIGDYVVIARQDRDSNDWYVGAVGDEIARDIVVDFDFLNDDAAYNASLYRDGEEADYRTDKRHDLVVEEFGVTKDTSRTIRIAPGGGFIVRLQPLP